MANFHFDQLLVESLSLSLMHFLWQACVMASVAAIGFAFLRLSPNGRYLWGVVCFTGFAVCPVATFGWLHHSSSFEGATAKLNSAEFTTMEVYPIQGFGDGYSEAKEDVLSRPSDFWQVGHAMIVAFWLLGQMFVGSRLLASGYFVYRLKQAAVPVESELRHIAQRLAKRMEIACPLVASAEHIGGAIAAGFFRHIIVIPTAWLTDMTTDMLEAVIAHEMAHLRRHDLWINLVQRIVESMLFFHPAVWWLSKRIRQDREVCCDLLAIQATQQRKQYAETLEHVARMESIRAELLVTNIGEDRMSLLRRVRLVLGQQPHASSIAWWPAGVLVVVIPAGLFWLSQSSSVSADQQEVQQRDNLIGPTPAIQSVDSDLPVVSVAGNSVEDKSSVKQIARVANAEHQGGKKWKLGEYIIEPPDVVKIEIDGKLKPKKQPADQQRAKPAKDDDGAVVMSGDYLVFPDGTVNLGIYGRVYISGKTLEKATLAVRDRLVRYFVEPKVQLDVLVINSKFFYVIMENNGVGDEVVRIPVTGNETVLDAVAQIGGLDQAGDRKLHIKRPGANGTDTQVMPIDWEAITRGAETATNYQMLPGDRLFIVSTEETGSSPVRSFLGQAAMPFPQSGAPGVVGATLPSPYYSYDDIQVYPPGPEFKEEEYFELQENGVTNVVELNERETTVIDTRRVVPSERRLPSSQLFEIGSDDQNPALPERVGELPWRDQSYQHRIPIAGPVTSGGKAKVIDPPTNDEIIRLIEVSSPDSTLAQIENRPHLTIVKKLIADYVDPSRFYPLIGPAQLHHAHYKCVMHLAKNAGNANAGKDSADTKTFFIDHHHLHVIDEADIEAAVSTRKGDRDTPTTTGEPTGKNANTSAVFSTVYYVGDLVVPLRKPRFTRTGEMKRVKDAKPDFDTLMELISSSISPNSWKEVGGSGSLVPFEGNLSLVVQQTEDVHEEIVSLLAQLRRLQESKVLLRATNLKLTSRLTKKLGIQGKVLVVLTAEEREQILSAVHRDARARTYADSKATLFNGQMLIDSDENFAIQAVVDSDKTIRLYAGVKAARDTDSPESTLPPNALLSNDQSLLVRMKSGSNDELTSFRLITAEAIESKEKSTLLR